MAQILAILATQRKWLTAGAAILVTSIALAACGGGSSSSSSTVAGEEPASGTKTTASEAPATEEREAGGEVEAGALTPPGTHLKVGETATVAWIPPGEYEPAEAQSGIELEATVEAIEEGSSGDLKNIELEPGEEGAVPFYVKLKLEAPTNAKVPAEEDPAYSFEAIDDRGQEQPSVTFLGDFEPCEDTPAPAGFSAGASYETCLTYLMQGGGSIEEVHWNSGPAKANAVTPYFEKPVVWAAAG